MDSVTNTIYTQANSNNILLPVVTIGAIAIAVGIALRCMNSDLQVKNSTGLTKKVNPSSNAPAASLSTTPPPKSPPRPTTVRFCQLVQKKPAPSLAGGPRRDSITEPGKQDASKDLQLMKEQLYKEYQKNLECAQEIGDTELCVAAYKSYADALQKLEQAAKETQKSNPQTMES